MCRFGTASDPGYIAVMAALKRIVKDRTKDSSVAMADSKKMPQTSVSELAHADSWYELPGSEKPRAIRGKEDEAMFDVFVKKPVHFSVYPHRGAA